MKYTILFVALFFFSFTSFEQNNHHEIGVEVQAASFSTHGGTVGGALKYALVNGEQLAFGPTIRFQYIWSKNQYYGYGSKLFTWGGGAFLHYRFLEWFFLGAEIEYLKNPYAYYNTSVDKRKWALTALVGGGVSKEFGPVRLNVGILYDIVDGVSDPHTTNPSPLSPGYFIKVSNPQKPNYGRYIPIIYRLALFIPINKNKSNDYDEYE